MFVETMSPEAIIKEVKRDVTALQQRGEHIFKAHRRDFLFAKKYPISCRAQWKSPLTHNKWHITLICNNKKERENPDQYHYATYETSRGIAVIFPVYSMNTETPVVSKFTAHFFSRYRTRYLIPNNLYQPGMNVIQYFVDHNATFYFPDSDSDKNFVCCLNGGIALGNEGHGISIFRTFVSEAMLFRIQERALRSSIEHQRILDDFINDKLPNSYKEYQIQGRIGKIGGFDPIPELRPEEVKDLLKNKPKIPLYPLPPNLHTEE